MTRQRSFSLDIIMTMTKQGFKDVFFVLAPIFRVYMKITPDMKTMMNMWHADKDDDNDVFYDEGWRLSTVMMMLMLTVMMMTSLAEMHSRLAGEWLIGSYLDQGPETSDQEIPKIIIINHSAYIMMISIGSCQPDIKNCQKLSHIHAKSGWYLWYITATFFGFSAKF